MAVIVLFHSVYGLRHVEIAAADRLRADGHEVRAPDLYAGRSAATIADGFALAERTGWAAITERARDAVRDLPATTVLAGISMGASVAEALLPTRPETAGVLLWHGLAEIPATTRPGLPVQVHIADPDQYFPAARVASFQQSAAAAEAVTTVFTYPGAGHFYTDPTLADHDRPASELTWQRSLRFLRDL
ncbi:dienelactone hydrolase family protein [Kitasatospora sp. NPDC094015]|uniref:dienelactone hydrolase family protein n=1 Tax=Kitasatospora sp. NPDC094015 TaxID=3155205 RepID=UPI0033172F42